MVITNECQYIYINSILKSDESANLLPVASRAVVGVAPPPLINKRSTNQKAIALCSIYFNIMWNIGCANSVNSSHLWANSVNSSHLWAMKKTNFSQ